VVTPLGVQKQCSSDREKTQDLEVLHEHGDDDVDKDELRDEDEDDEEDRRHDATDAAVVNAVVRRVAVFS